MTLTKKNHHFKRKNAMTDGIYACLWIIKEQRALPNHEGVNSPTALAIADAYAAVENWLAQQKKEAKELEEAATCETFPFKQTL
jgi:hypothetical protein|tara:strand:- start:365 stop:616 length:252 start_codon:yes stop_codon:yes gene_type:complete